MELFISSVALFVSIFLFRFSIGSFSIGKLSMIGYVFYFHIIMLTYIGVVAVVLNLDIKYNTYFFAITGAAHDESRRLGWYTTMYAIIVLPIGMILANILFFGKMNASPFIRKYQFKKIANTFKTDRDEKILFVTLVIFVAIATLSVLYVFFIIKTFPLYSMLSGEDHFILQQLRGAAKFEFKGVAAIRDMIALPLTPLLSYITYIAYKKTNLIKFKLLFYYLVILSILILTYNTEKAPVLFYGMSFLFLQSFVGNKVNTSKLFFYGLLVLFLLILMYFVVSGLEDISDILNLLLARIFVAQTSAIFLCYEYFPSIHDFFGWGGASHLFADLSSSSYYYPHSPGRTMFSIYSPESIANGTAGSMASLFTAEAWMLFGLNGVLLAPLWVGFFIQTIHLLIIKSSKNSVMLSMYLYIMMHWSLASGFTTFVYPIRLMIFSVQVFAIYFILQVIKDIFLRKRGTV